MNDPSPRVNPSPEEMNALYQRILELERSNRQCQQQVEQLTQQLTQEKAARHQAEEHLQLTLTSAQMVSWDVDLVTNRVICSPNALEAWGMQEGSGEDFLAVIHPDDRQQVIQAAERAVAGETDYLQEYRIIRPDGAICWLNSRGKVYLDAAGQGVRMIGLSVDVTDRKQAELHLQESQRFIQQIADAMPGTLYVYDMLEQQNVYVNRQIGELLGYTPKQIQAFGDQLFAQLIHPEDFATIGTQFERLNQGKDGEAIDYEYRMRHADGSWRWLWSRNTVSTRTPDGRAHQVVGTVHDITDRKQAEALLQQREQELRQSEERLRLAMEGAQMATWDVDLSTGKAIWSEQHFRMLGYEPVASGEASEQMWSSQIHPADLEQVIQVWQQARLDHTLYQAEYRVIRADNGQIAWLAGLGSFTYDSSDKAIRSIGVLFDITARKQAEFALAESNQTLQAIIQACPLAIMGLQADGTVRIWNPAAERIFGWSQQEVLGRFLPAIPDDKRNEFLANLAATIQGQGLTAVEAQRQKKDNVLFDVELWTAPVDEAQTGISCVSVVADITARKRTEAALRLNEERLHSFVTANVIGILFGDLEGGIQEANDELLRIVGYTREEMQAGKLRWIDITPPEYLPLDEAAIIEARQRGACTPYEKEYIRRDGTRVSVLVGFGLVLAGREEAVAFVLDLSDRKQAEAEREQLLRREQAAREQAEAANRVKDEFLAVLSHELRTPLNPILGWTQLLRTRSFEQKAADRALETIERNAKLLTQLIEDLLDVSRILQGKVRLESRPVNLVTTIEAALETVRLSAEAKAIQIQTVLDAQTGPVNGDANRLQQVVWNLLSNAVKFTPAHGKVEVHLESVDRPANSLRSTAYAQIRVSDTGQGISSEFLPHVFEYFRQADSSTTRQFGGLGLGLAIVRHLVELHGGTVTAESLGSNMGATFTVQLPLMASTQSPALATSRTSATNSLHNVRILVVDDEADMRELMRFILEEQGATVSVAASATEALQQLTQSMPDILISDIGMPGMDGHALMQQIRATFPSFGKTIPAIALTAYAGEVNQRQALAAGFQLHLAKPIEPEQLLKSVIQMLPRSSKPSF